MRKLVSYIILSHIIPIRLLQIASASDNLIQTYYVKAKVLLYSELIIFLLVLVYISLYSYAWKKTNKEKEKIEEQEKMEKAILSTEKQQMERELLNAKRMLLEYMRMLEEKNEQYENIKTQQERNNNNGEFKEAQVEQLVELHKVTILTDEDWDKFQELFEQAYKGFLIRLKNRLPNLSESEIRYVCLTKLRVSTKKMANILGVSPDAIGMTRYRLKKKLCLADNKSLWDTIETI